MDTSEKQKQKLILSITNFLLQEKKDSKFKQSEQESLDVTIQCLEQLYGLDQSTKEQLQSDVKNLHELLSMEDLPISADAQHEAEESKNRGNEAMNNNDYVKAIQEYTKAITLHPKNPVYYCNRAAAYNKGEQPFNAIVDCKKAIKLDPKYSKAFGRLGKAYSMIGLNKEAYEAYLSALKFDPSNEMYQENIKFLEESQDSNLSGNGLFNNSTLLNMILKLMENDSFRDMLETLTTNQNDTPYLNNLLQMGQMLVHKLQSPDQNKDVKLLGEKLEKE